MKIAAHQLDQHLSGDLSSFYWVSGDEILLREETLDAIRRTAKARGFLQRTVWHIDQHTDWSEILTEANSMSLFADLQMIELRFNNGKPAAKGIEQLANYMQQPNSDTLILVSSPKLEANSLKTKAYKALEPNTSTIQVWPIEANELPSWLTQRAQKFGLRFEPDALKLLSDRVEGNLLAAQQELDKIALLVDTDTVTFEWLNQLLANHARYSNYHTLDAALAGDSAAVIRSLRSMRSEGTPVILIANSFIQQIRKLIDIRHSAKQKGPNQALKEARIWPQKREALIRGSLKRLNMSTLEQALKMSAEIDMSIKGQLDKDPWDLLEQLGLVVALGLVSFKS